MISATLKIINNDYSTGDPIYSLLNYIYKFDNYSYKVPYDIYAYGFPSNDTCPNTTINLNPNDYTTLYDLFSYNPPATYAPTDLSKDVAHFIISIKDKKFTTNYKFFLNAIAFNLGKTYRTAFSFHTDTDNAHAHFIVSTKNINAPDKTLTKGLLLHYYVPLFTHIATQYGYDLKLKG